MTLMFVSVVTMTGVANVGTWTKIIGGFSIVMVVLLEKGFDQSLLHSQIPLDRGLKVVESLF